MQVFQIDGIPKLITSQAEYDAHLAETRNDFEGFPHREPDPEWEFHFHGISSMVARPWGIGENLFLYVSDDVGVTRIVKFVPKTGQSSEFRIMSNFEFYIRPVPTFSTDGKWYTSWMKIFRVDDGVALVELQGLPSQVSGIVSYTDHYIYLLFSYDKKTLFGIPGITQSGVGWRIDRWRLNKVRAQKQIQIPARNVDSLSTNQDAINPPVAMAITQSGEQLAAISYSGRQIYRWNLKSNTNLPTIVLRRISGFEVDHSHLTYSPDSRWLVVAGTETVILGTADSAPHAAINTGPVRSLAITLDSQTVLTVNGEHRLEQWHIPSGEKLREYSFEDLIGPAECVTVSPDGFTAYVAGTEGRFLRWDLE